MGKWRPIIVLAGLLGGVVGCGSNGAGSGGGGAMGSGGKTGVGGATGAAGGPGAGGSTSSGGAPAAGGVMGMAGLTGAAGITGSAGAGGAMGGAGGAVAATGGAVAATGGAFASGGRGGGAGGRGGTPNATGGAGGATAVKAGTIAVTQTLAGAATSANATAQFVRMIEVNLCQPSTMGSCRFYKCGTTSGQGSSYSYFQAETVKVTGLAMPLPLALAADRYRSDTFTETLWTASRPASAQVTGTATVPAVTLDLIAPNPITVTAPVAAAGASLKISKATDLVATWTGGVEGTVEVELTNDNAGVLDISIKCTAAANAGTLTLPSAFLTALGTKGTFQAGVQNVATKQVDDWTMQFSATTRNGPVDVMYTR